MKRLTALLAAVLLGVMTLAGTAPASAASSPVLDRGEVGVFDLTLDGETPVLELRDATGVLDDRVVYRAPEDVVLRVSGDAAQVDDPQGTRYEVPADPAAELPTFSWTTERLPAAVVPSASLALSAEGPGEVTISASSEDGTEQTFTSANPEQDTLTVPAATTAGLAWTFATPGTYVVTATPSLNTAEGVVFGPQSSYTIEVTEPSVPAPEMPSQQRVPLPDPVAPSASEPAAPAVPEVGRAQAVAPRAANTVIEQCFGAEVSATAETVDDGHFDFGVQVIDGALDGLIKDDRSSPAQWREPGEVLFRLDEPARMPVPAGPTFDFLGDPGADVWMVGQTQANGVPWLGWNTQHPSAVSGINGPTTWRLDSVEGPGELFVFSVGSFGTVGQRFFGSTEDWPKQTSIPANVHVHGNIAFTEPGVYRVTTTHEATLTGGGTSTNTETLTFLVGPCDPPTQPDGELSADQLLADEELTESNRGDVTVDSTEVETGDRLTVSVPSGAAHEWLMPVFYSEPQQTTWTQLSDTRALGNVTVPELESGDHKVALYTTDGELRGWAPITVAAADPDDDPGTDPGDDPGDRPDNDPGNDPAEDPGADPAPDGDDTPGPGAGGGATSPGGKTPTPEVCASGTRGNGSGSGGGAGGSGGGSGGAATTVSDGHFDFGPVIEDGALIPRVKDDRSQPPQWVDPTSLVFQLGGTAEQTVPEGEAYSFLGSPGDTIWMMPQTQIDGVPWLGWNTQHESVRSEVSGPVTFTLDSVEGPGQLAVYLNDSFGGVGQRMFGNVSGFPSSFDVPLNVHAHGNWAFSEPGTYRVTITQSATLQSGGQVSEAATLTFSVGGGGTSGASMRDEGVTTPAIVRTSTASTTVATGEKTTAADCVLPKAGAPEDVAHLLLLGALFAAGGIALVAVSTRRSLGSLA